jgi:hypothetical protein
LATEGFSRVHSRIQLRLVGHFNRWLEQMHLTAEQLHEDVCNRALSALAQAQEASAL